MRRIDAIMKHPLYQKWQKKIDEWETNRIFCRHGMEHALDVARIFYIQVLEQKLSYPKDMVYAAALLHDIGRAQQYAGKGSHHEMGADIAEEILRDSGYSTEETGQICDAIRAHQRQEGEENSFTAMLYAADKLSRNCFACQAQEECYWTQERRNHTITI